MTSLEHAISIATSAHAGYLADDKEPYIFHTLRVMLALDTEDERIVGVLHDVIEKTPLTLDSLRSEGLPDHILEAIKTDVKNAGANWKDKEVVTDEGIITSRSPDDLPAFVSKIVEEIEEGTHKSRAA